MAPPLRFSVVPSPLRQEEVDWNELNGIQNVKQINSYECKTIYVLFQILVNTFDKILIEIPVFEIWLRETDVPSHG